MADSVLVVGGGVTGIQAALDLADRGIKVHIIEKSPSIGGVMTQLDKTFPTNDCSMCILAPKLVAAGRHPNITLHTLAEVKEFSGEKGKFSVKILEKPRSVDVEKCTGCGICTQKCPVKVADSWQRGLAERKAIYLSFPQAFPLAASIDRENCLYFQSGVCKICEKFCPSGAINFEEEARESELEVGSVILALGYETFDPSALTEYGYGRYPNVMTSIEFERMLSATGPTGGPIQRLSDSGKPEKIAFIQCVGSRDSRLGREYCSGVCCMYAIKEAVIAKEHSHGLDASIFYMDIRAFGKEFEYYYSRAEKEHQVQFKRNRIASLREDPETRQILLSYVEGGDVVENRYDLVILSVGLEPPTDSKQISEIFKIRLNGHGFAYTSNFNPVESSRQGVYICGAFNSPMDIPDGVAQASGAAAKAAQGITISESIDPAKDVAEKEVTGQPPRVGVFVCHCGINIGGVVDVPGVAEYARSLPGVVYAEENMYTCSQDTQDQMKKLISEYDLNRVVVASCTPRTHEPLFRETMEEAGLNPYLFEMANIRDQCSWVHMQEPEEATEKSKDLIRMAVAKARLLKPLEKPVISMTPIALVIGGGYSGMTSALEIAEQGFKVHLVEKKGALGGNLRRIKYLSPGMNPQRELEVIIKNVSEHPLIRLHLESEVVDASGYIGNFESTIKGARGNETIQHGVTIIATGGSEYNPVEYLYGEDGIMTQLEFKAKLSEGYSPETVVMIQCVGSRNDERPYCSRVCCTNAVNNALKVKENNPDADVFILYKDMRTYGFREDYYREAAEKGVIFINYTDEDKPEVSYSNVLQVTVTDLVLNEKVMIKPDAVILSAAIIPGEDNVKLAGLYKVPLNRDGFFLEAHMKLRPVDFATNGIYLAGLAHGPKFVEESISQALGAAARALTVLSKPKMTVDGAIATVDEEHCSSCRMCISVCPYNAIEMRETDDVFRSHVIPEVCKGCGVCATTCPSGAISMGHFTDEEILIQVKTAFQEVKR